MSQPEAGPADLAHDTQVVRDPDVAGRYHARLPNHWDYLLPSGGVVMTLALRAAQAELAEPELRLISATSIFCKPVPAAACRLDVTVLRRGATVAQVRTSLFVADVLAMEVVASFGRRRIGPTVAGAAFPAVLALADSLVTVGGTPLSYPHSAAATSNPYAMFRFYQQLETRIADGDIHWRDMDRFVAGPARYGRWMRYRLPQRDADGHFDRLALAPLIDTIPSALHRAIGPGDYRFYAPSLDLTLHVVADTTREWLMLRSFVRAAADGYGIGEIEVWDDECRLIAYGTQAMYLQTVAGTPPVVDASRR